jgi:hypothetical protein
MSEQSTFQPRAGHRREPGPDPVPEKRKSTQPTELEMAAVKPDRAPVQPRKRSCGSHKPKERLRKELLNLIVQEGLLELSEQKETEVSEPDSTRATHPKTTMVIWCENSNGELVARNPDGSECEPDAQAPASTSELERVLAERKIKELLSRTQLVLDLGPLVEAALKNQKLRDQLLISKNRATTRKSSNKPSSKPATAKPAGSKERKSTSRGLIKSSQVRVKISPTGQKVNRKKGTTVH